MPHHRRFRELPRRIRVHLFLASPILPDRLKPATAIINTGLPRSLIERHFAQYKLNLRPGVAQSFTFYAADGLQETRLKTFSPCVVIPDNEVLDSPDAPAPLARIPTRVPAINTTLHQIGGVERILDDEPKTKLVLGMDFLARFNWSYTALAPTDALFFVARPLWHSDDDDPPFPSAPA